MAHRDVRERWCVEGVRAGGRGGNINIGEPITVCRRLNHLQPQCVAEILSKTVGLFLLHPPPCLMLHVSGVV
jgi:hypothetical protein